MVMTKFMNSHGGRRIPGPGKKLGAPKGHRADTVKLGISISRKNAEWLRSQTRAISRNIDIAINEMREREEKGEL